jgi:hypothetical protein
MRVRANRAFQFHGLPEPTHLVSCQLLEGYGRERARMHPLYATGDEKDEHQEGYQPQGSRRVYPRPPSSR